jgi:hypothetical protein
VNVHDEHQPISPYDPPKEDAVYNLRKNNTRDFSKKVRVIQMSENTRVGYGARETNKEASE